MNRYHKLLFNVLVAVILLGLPDLAIASQPEVSNEQHVLQTSRGIRVTPAPASSYATNLISDYGCGVTNGGNRTVILSGRTSSIGYGIIDYLKVTVYLQRWSGSSWVNVTSRTYTGYDTDLVDDFDSISVTAGQYRAIATHDARDGTLTDSRSSSSGSITI